MENYPNNDEFKKELEHLKEEIQHEKAFIEHEEKEIHNEKKEIEFLEKELEELVDYQSKEMIIYVNTREKVFNDKEISFRQVVSLAYENPVFTDQFIYTVSYSKGVDKKPKGFLTDNETICVKNKMIFDVERANRS